MKKITFLSLLMLVALFTACTQKEENENPAPLPGAGVTRYEGKLTSSGSSASDSAVFVMNTVLDVAIDKASSTLDIVLNDVKFAEKMPLVLDITLKNIPYSSNAGVLSFSAENVAPYMNKDTVAAPDYMFAVVQGSITADELLFSAVMSDSIAPYIAGNEFVFSGKETASNPDDNENNKGEEDVPAVPAVKSQMFYGDLLLNDIVVSDDARCGLDILNDSAAITLYGATFAPNMPAMDIVVPALNCAKVSDSYVISADSTIATVNGEPIYRMTLVEATLTDTIFVFSAATERGTIGFSNKGLNDTMVRDSIPSRE